jgi:hypothetical protein
VLQLGDALVQDAGIDDRGHEQAAAVVEGPLVVEPLVERVDGDLGECRVVEQTLFDQAGQGREDERRVDALLI